MDHLQGETFIVDNAFEMDQLTHTIAAAHGIETVFLGTGNPCYSPYVMHRWSHGLHIGGKNINVERVSVHPSGDFPIDNYRTFQVHYPR